MNVEKFNNQNGNSYVILALNSNRTALLCKIAGFEAAASFVVCKELNFESHDWYHGAYFDDFEEAYNYYRRIVKD